MKLRYFGDSYDIVKKSLISWLGEFGPWSVHPMFTEPVTEAEADRFAHFLDARLVSSEVLLPDTDRAQYFNSCRDAHSLFLDPDTGVYLQENCIPRKRIAYIFPSELIPLVLTRPAALTLVFDQSLPRGQERSAVENKLKQFASNSVHGFAYVSHASFLILAAGPELAQKACDALLMRSSLPESRMLRI